jgi:hypothetical protein
VSTRFDVEEIQTTKSEKLLAVVLAVFLLIGGIWAYQRIDDEVARALAPSGEVQLSPEEEAAIQRFNQAQGELNRSADRAARAREELELKREEYRTALDAGRAAPKLELQYRQAQAEFDGAEQDLLVARQAAAEAEAAARPAFQHRAEAFQQSADRHELVAFLLRLGLVLLLVGLGYWLLAHLRSLRSRYFPLAFAVVATATVMAFVMAGDYITDYLDPLEFGPLILSVVGGGATLAAFVGVQRYLSRRLPQRRARKLQCPFCGYPVHGNERCEGCGREVIAECSSCGSPRRVGTLHCGACGQA